MSVFDIATRYDAFTSELRRVVEETYGPVGLTFASWVSLYSHDIVSGIELGNIRIVGQATAHGHGEPFTIAGVRASDTSPKYLNWLAYHVEQATREHVSDILPPPPRF